MQKKYIYATLGGVLLASAGGYALYHRNYSNDLTKALLDYVGALKHENDSQKKEGETIVDISNQTAQNIAQTYAQTKPNVNVQKDLIKTKDNIPVSKLVVNFYTAMAGASTNTALFYDTLYSIKNLFTLHLVTEVYQKVYGRKWVDDVLSEVSLSGAFSNAKTLPAQAAFAVFGIIPAAATLLAVSNKLNPQIVNYIAGLPQV